MVDSWKYVAGFFDGEGCVWWCVGRSVAQASMSQKLPEVLYQIQAFLETQGIKSSMRPMNRKYTNSESGTQPAHSLEVQGWTNVVPFLKNIVPYLQTIKRTASQDVLRAHVAFPQISRKMAGMLIHEGFSDNPAGSQSEAIKKSWVIRRQKVLKPGGWTTHRAKYRCNCNSFSGSCQKLVAA